jgi:hypothetical protein
MCPFTHQDKMNAKKAKVSVPLAAAAASAVTDSAVANPAAVDRNTGDGDGDRVASASPTEIYEVELVDMIPPIPT